MKFLTIGLLFVVVAIAGCVGQTTETTTPTQPSITEPTAPTPSAPAETPTEPTSYLDIPLRDVRTGETFKLSDFSGKVVVIETMAVWCPLCTDQQRQIRAAEAALASEDVVSVSLDIDPNEDDARLLGHVERQGFLWRFAVAPTEVSKQLRDNFGLNVLNPPSTPVIILDRQQTPHLLRFGIKSSSELQGEIQKYL